MKATSWLSLRSGGKHICKRRIPTLYMSNLSGLFKLHSTGLRAAATGVGGALGVDVLMMYFSGGAYLGSRRNSLGK